MRGLFHICLSKGLTPSIRAQDCSGMTPTPPRESIFQRILREAQERRECQAERMAEQIKRIEQRAKTHGNPQTAS